MARRVLTQLAYDALTLEGGLLNAEWLAKVAHLEAPKQKPDDYGIPDGLNLRDEIARAWRIAQALWLKFNAGRSVQSSFAVSAVTEKFVAALLEQAFEFRGLYALQVPYVLGERTFPVTHARHHIPVVIAPHNADLDDGLNQFGEGGRRRSAFGLLQEYLNTADDALWGLVCNGLRLRLVRDNSSLTRPAWLEADLERIFTEERFADFSALWLAIHVSRFGASGEPPVECVLESWRSAGQQAGVRVREQLRNGVQFALRELGQGFLTEPSNAALRSSLVKGTLTPQAYFQQLLRLVYRLIFLVTVEERGVLHPPGSDASAQALYECGYGVRRLRERAARHSSSDVHRDLYAALRVTLKGLAAGEPRLALPALGGLFDEMQTPELDAAHLQNRHLLAAIRGLAWVAHDNAIERVNWRDMGPEELGSVYESLLELVPRIGEGAQTFSFAEGDETRGNERKRSGSYYTPDSLVQALLDSALEPVIARKITERPQDEVRAVLSITVIDPAVGSGHFLLAAARRLAAHLARARAQGQPSVAEHRRAMREVVSHCVYGVDRNPMALELAKISLWLEAMTPEAPLSFLDAHLVLGDSLLGILDPSCLANGIPDDAYKPLTGDDATVCTRLKRRNREARKILEKLAGQGEQRTLEFATETVAAALAELDAMSDESLQAVAAKQAAFDRLRAEHEHTGLAEDFVLSAYLMRKQQDSECLVPTSEHVLRALTNQPLDKTMIEVARRTARRHRVFHWRDAFAHVFRRGGFDCVLGNPPWERVKLQEQEFFASRAPQIAEARNKADRTRAIRKLMEAAAGSPERRIHEEFEEAKRLSEAASAFVHDGVRFPLTGSGDVNTYALFAETSAAITPHGTAGLVLPTGIATDSTTSAFFGVISQGRLDSLYSFKEIRDWFPETDDRNPFCLLTIGNGEHAKFGFFLDNISDIYDDRRTFHLTPDDIRRLNPNTFTCPTFRSSADAAIAKKIYSRVPVLSVDNEAGNPWGIDFLAMFHMSNDSELLRTIERKGELSDPAPLCEAKMIHQFDHRWATYGMPVMMSGGHEESRDVTDSEKDDAQFVTTPRYWVERNEVKARIAQKGWRREWALCYRDICRAGDIRTLIASVVRVDAIDGGIPLILPTSQQAAASKVLCLLANLNSIVCDYLARQKISGAHLKYFHLRQLPVLGPNQYSDEQVHFIVPRVLELVYTGADLHALYSDVISEDAAFDPRRSAERGRPFRWIPERRAKLRGELDAYYATLYGLSVDELRYVLDPANAKGPDYPSESFRVLKEKELRQFGEYRTRRLVLQAWDALAQSERITVPAWKPARRSTPRPIYAEKDTPSSSIEDWLGGLICDVIHYGGSVNDSTIRLILTTPLATGAAYSDDLANWLAPLQADRLPHILSWLRMLLGIPQTKDLSIGEHNQLAEVMGDHRTEALARSLVDTYRARQKSLCDVMTSATTPAQERSAATQRGRADRQR